MAKQKTPEQQNSRSQDPRPQIPNRLLVTLGLSGLAFLVTGLAIQRFAAPPSMALLIDRSYCPATQWQTLTDKYARLYQQHQRKQLKIEYVILFSDLNQTKLETIPAPNMLKTLKTYGQYNVEAQRALLASHGGAQVLSCQSAD